MEAWLIIAMIYINIFKVGVSILIMAEDRNKEGKLESGLIGEDVSEERTECFYNPVGSYGVKLKNFGVKATIYLESSGRVITKRSECGEYSFCNECLYDMNS